MIRNLFAALVILGVSVAVAKDSTTKPAATQPGRTVATAIKADVPVKPVTPAKAKPDSATADEHFPTPNEIMEKIKAKKAEVDKLLKVAHFDLSQPILEKTPDITLFGDANLLTIHNLIDRLHRARDDKGVRAVLITLSANSGFNTAQALEIKNALGELRKAGKRSFVYADAYDTPTYLAASGATDVCLLEGGEIEMLGVDIEPMFLKGLFEKFGVKADFIQIGEFKGADEMYTRSELSEESKGELTKLADSLYNLITATIAHNRNISPNAVKQIIDDVFLTAKQAKDRKLIDHLVSQDDLRDLITEELHGEINIVPNYAEPQPERLDFSNPLALLTQMGKKPAASNKSAIALIHAEGEIVDGEAEDGLLGGGGNVGSENIRKAFRMASRDDSVKAIVLRIDSPGGSALASEVMWQAVHAAAQDKPVIISVGSMAASGGYYLASAGDYIFADPSAIVGSIGVVGGKFVIGGIFEKLGITTQAITRGANANINSMTEPWTDRQRRLMTNMMKSTYEQFTQRVMTNRNGKIKDIDQVARGRIFLAGQAKDLGMVDEIGGLTEALAYAASEAKLKDYDVKSLPGSRSIIDLITGRSGGADDGPDARLPYKAKIELSIDSPLKLMPTSMRKLFLQQLQTLELLDKRPVILVSPYVITVK
jgi:protease-4